MNEPDAWFSFGSWLPLYPELPQIVRVAASALPGTNVYPAFVQQLAPPLALRDREPCYTWEPNGIRLGAGYYDTRLVGSYLGLPLYAATCCPVGVSSNSSSSG